MYTYSITSEKLGQEYLSKLQTETEVRHWVINTLDLSGDWTIKKL